MTQLSSEEITHFANLARLNITGEEKEKFSQELPKVIGFVEQLREVKLGSEETDSKAVPLENLRADEVDSERLTHEQLEKLAPNWQNRQVTVPAVFSEAEDV